MGINGLLPRILPSAGRENYDLRALKDGIVAAAAPTQEEEFINDADEQQHQNPPPSKRRRRPETSSTNNTTKSDTHKRSSWTRRKVRIAVDVNGWISRAAHGYGGTLMDERHLSYHGRAELRNQKEQQEQRQLEGVGRGREEHDENEDDGEHDDAANRNNNSNDAPQQQQQQQQQIQAEQRLQYIQKIVSFTLKKIESMRDECSALVLPVLDGNTPPCKREVVKERSDRRKRAVEEREQLLVQGIGQNDDNSNAEGGAAVEENNNNINDNEAARTEAEVLSKISKSKSGGMGKDYSMRRDLLSALLDEFRNRKWPFIVAPYEADGQLAFLANIGAVDIVVTEDSDLIGLGVPTLVYKLGGWNGSNAANRGVLGSAPSSHLGTMLHRRDLGSSHDIDLLDFTDAMLATMFVTAGCDYCANLKGIGVKTARNIVKRAFHGANADSEVAVNSLVVRSEPVLKLVLHALFNECGKEARAELLPLDDPSKAEVRMAYESKFLAALAMYRHPLVYDPIQGVHLVANDVSDGFERSSISPIFLKDERILMEYEPYKNLVTNRESLYEVIGSPSSPEIAKGIAEGVIDPRRIPAETEPAVPEDGQGEETSTTLQSGSELLSSQDFSGAGTQQSKYSSSEGISSPDLLASPSPLRNLV